MVGPNSICYNSVARLHSFAQKNKWIGVTTETESAYSLSELVKHYTNLHKKHWCLWTTVRCYDRKQMAPHAVCSLSHMRSNTFYRILERLCTNLVLRTRSLVAPGNYNERLKKHSAIVLIFKWSFISCKRLSILFNDKRFTESYLIRMAREFCQQKPHKLMAQGPNREIGKVRSNTENSPFYQ